MSYKDIRNALPLLLPRVGRRVGGGIFVRWPLLREFLLLALANGRTVVLNYKTSQVGTFDATNPKGTIVCFSEFHAPDTPRHDWPT